MKRRLTVLGIVVLNLFLLLGCGEKSNENSILDTKVLWNNSENLYEIPLTELEGVEQSTVYRVGDDLLFAYDTYDEEKGKNVYELKLVSIENGKLLYTKQLESLVYGEIQVLDNHIAVNDLGDGKCHLLNDKLEEVGVYEIEGGMFCIDKTGKKAYQFTYNEGIKVIELDTLKTETMLENAVNLYRCKTGKDEATFAYTDRNNLLRSSGILDLESGEVNIIESPYAYGSLETGKDTWLGEVEGVTTFYVLSDGEKQGIFYSEISTMIGVNNASGHVMFWDAPSEGENLFLLYDNKGNLLSECTANGLYMYQMVDFAWYEEYNGYFFTMTDENNKAHLMFWDVSGDVIENELDLEDVKEATKKPEGSAVSKELFDRASSLSEKYGVEILIADQCDTVFSDHSAELLLDEAEIAQALDTVDYVLGRYPEGFFEQLKHNSSREIEIQLVGILQKDYSTDENIYISGGFVNYTYAGKLLMALDARAMKLDDEINPILEETMYHEISHIIDKRIDYDSLYRENASYSEMGWIELNPEGFEYNDSYYGTLNPQYADYFVDNYACTNSTEDRARIMEYAMFGEVGVFAGKEGLTKKLIYYSNGIRDSFDTTGWPEKLPWDIL